MNDSLAAGQIVTWTPPKSVGVTVLKNAVKSAGLDDKLVRKMIPRNAFARAAQTLEKNRIVRKFEEEKGTVSYQLTKEFREENQLTYGKEAILVLDKESGSVACEESPELAEMFERMIADQSAVRNSADITRLVQSIFAKQDGDLVSIREAGGVYFVPDSQQGIVVQVARFLSEIGGALRRFTVGIGGDEETSASIADSIKDHFSGLIAEFQESIEVVDGDSSRTIVNNRMESMNTLKVKLKTFRHLLSGQAEVIDEALNAASEEFDRRRGASVESSPEVAAQSDSDATTEESDYVMPV